ncbi:MAG TPA: flagellin, partial [Pseudobdellovibrionaceae bacterium]|nr:flagellin [Pseudobdellovibrionaceae bacterium]
ELGIEGLSISRTSDAKDLLGSVDTALTKVGSMRANFGAIQNRLESATSNLDTQIENLSAARSRIADTDIARESSELASAQVLQQAAVSVLSQANQFPQMALRLVS